MATGFDINGNGYIDQNEFFANAYAFGFVFDGGYGAQPVPASSNGDPNIVSQEMIFGNLIVAYDNPEVGGNGNGQLDVYEADVYLSQATPIPVPTASSYAPVPGTTPYPTSTTPYPTTTTPYPTTTGAPPPPTGTATGPLPQFNTIDINGDGLINGTEYQQANIAATSGQQFSQIDTSGDGLIDGNEWAAANTSTLPQFNTVDTSGDGLIDGNEYQTSGLAAQTGLQFNQIDTNGNGLIDGNEWAAANQQAAPPPPPTFAQIDTNGDGIIYGNEFSVQAATIGYTFAQVDINGDGGITGDEYNSVVIASQNQMVQTTTVQPPQTTQIV